MATKYLDDNGLLYLWGKLKAAFLSAISYNTTSKKIQATKNGSTSDIVTASDLVLDGGGVKSVKVGDASAATPDANGQVALPAYPVITGKADKVANATSGNFAGLDENGNLVDSGHKHSDYITSHQDISGKADKVTGATNGNFAGLDSNGNLLDSGNKAADFVLASSVGSASGVCPLDGNRKVDSQYLPSYVDDVVEIIAYETTAPATCAKGDQYYNSTSKKLFTATATDTWSSTGEDPENGKIYVLTADSTTYAAGTQFRWGGSDMVKLNDGGVTAITNAEIDVIVAS